MTAKPYRIEWRPKAREDLRAIVRYIAKDNPLRARTFGLELRNKTLPLADRIVFSPTGTPKHKVVVLTDIECGYCRKFHSEIAEINRRGIEVEYLAFPRAGLGSADYRKMVSVWCADDRKKALTDAKNDRAVPNKTCKTPVDMQYNAGLRMGLEGTPMLLTTDGQFLGGYLPPDVLQQRLEQVEAERGKASGGA